MLGTGKLTAPLLTAEQPATTAAPEAMDEFDCRGFEAKPLTGGVQMAHGKKITFVKQGDSPKMPTWAAAQSKAAHAEIRYKHRRLLMAIAASTAVMLIELIGGIYSHSLALMSDSAHMLADIASYCIALVALEVTLPLDLEASTGGCGPKEALAQKLSQKLGQRASYGMHRVEVLGGLGSILVIWLTAGGLLYEGVSRLAAQLFGGPVPTIDGTAFCIVAACGLVCNVMILHLFRDVAHSGHSHGHSHDHGHSHGHGQSDVTAQAAIVHAMGDIAQSIGMLVTAALITWNGAQSPRSFSAGARAGARCPGRLEKE